MLRFFSARIAGSNKRALSSRLLRTSACASSTSDKQYAFVEQQRSSSHIAAAAAASYPDHFDHSQGIQNYRDPPAPVLKNCDIDVNSETYLQAMERTETQVAELNERIIQVQEGGGARAVERHLNRNKLLARDRMQVLCDPGTPLLEFSALAGNMDGIPSGGIVTAIGMVAGRLCMMIANDATVKGGTYFPITVKKHLRAQEIALENNLPCIYLVDSGGAFLPEQAKVFPDKEHFGRIFFNQANMSAQGIPQVAVICGSCTAGGAYIPSMSDESIIVKGNGTIFLGGPPLVKAATGEEISAEALGGANVHAEISGVVDHMAATEEEALHMTRHVIANLGHDTHGSNSASKTPDRKSVV